MDSFKESDAQISKFLKDNELSFMHINMWLAARGYEVHSEEEMNELVPR